MKSIIAFVVLALIAVCVAEDLVDCKSKFVVPDEKEDPSKLSGLCAKELKLPEPKEDDKPPTKDEFIKSNYDDKCLAKCTLEKLSLLKDGKLIKEKTLEHAEKLVVKGEDAFLKIVKGYTEECLKGAEKLEDPKGCAAPSYFVFCVMEAQEKVCLPDKPEKP